jgi:hypothetical protein
MGIPFEFRIADDHNNESRIQKILNRIKSRMLCRKILINRKQLNFHRARSP